MYFFQVGLFLFFYLLQKSIPLQSNLEIELVHQIYTGFDVEKRLGQLILKRLSTLFFAEGLGKLILIYLY